MLLYQLTEDKAGLYSHIAHSIAEYEWAVGVLHRSSSQGDKWVLTFRPHCQPSHFPVIGTVSSQRKGLFTYMYYF